jgi:hypothetical protein
VLKLRGTQLHGLLLFPPSRLPSIASSALSKTSLSIRPVGSNSTSSAFLPRLVRKPEDGLRKVDIRSRISVPASPPLFSPRPGE